MKEDPKVITLFTGVDILNPSSIKKVNHYTLAYLSDYFSKNSENILVRQQKVGGFRAPFFKGIVNRYIYYFLTKRGTFSDINHILDHANAALALLIPKSSFVIITCHDVANFIFDQRNIINELVKKGLKRANLLITPSQSTKRDLIRLLNISPKKIVVIPNGVDHDLYRTRNLGYARKKLKLDPKIKIVLSIGSEIKRKNLDTLFRSFKLLQDRDKDTVLIRVGIPNGNSLKLIKKLGIKNKVLYMSNLSEQDLSLLYNASNLFLFPSIYEGFGLPVLEALASGVPVITSNTSSLPEITGGAAIEISPLMDPTDIAHEMYKVLNNEKVAKKLVKLGIKQSRKFSWDKTISMLVKTYFNSFKNKHK